MKDPQLVTAPDERTRCCVIRDDGKRCLGQAVYQVQGAGGYEDYTHCCRECLPDVRRPDDRVYTLEELGLR